MLQDEQFMIVLHNCGNTGHCTKAMVATGAHGIHLGNKCDMKQIIEDAPEDILVMGNLDPVTVFKQATPDEVVTATTELLEKMKPYSNFVLSSGCDTPPHTPLENIDAFFSTLKAHNE